MAGVFLYISCFVIACNEESQNDKDVEVIIISTDTEFNTAPHETDVTKTAVIQYNVKNIGTKIINGWEIFFNVRLQRGPQLIASDNLYYTLEPGIVSSVQLARVLIPEYYEEARGSQLKHIEIW